MRSTLGFVVLGISLLYFAAMTLFAQRVLQLEPQALRFVAVLAWPALVGAGVLLLRTRTAQLSDSGFLMSEEGQPRLWAAVPITPMVSPLLTREWVEAVVIACQTYNRLVGLKLFEPVQRTLAGIAIDKPGFGLVKFRPSVGTEEGASAQFFPEEPPTSSALVTLPVFGDHTRDLKIMIVMHELGHVLGLAHDSDVASVMHPTLDGRPVALSLRDMHRIAEAYAPKPFAA